MKKKEKQSRTSRIVVLFSVIILLGISLYALTHGRHYFSRRGIRQIQQFVNSYGILSPLAILSLIVVSTVIPPLPLPILLIEIAAGAIFSFWPAFIIVWFSQIVSSLLAFIVTRSIGKRLFSSFFNSRIVSYYRRYLEEKGPFAVLILRATMAAPFNVISFLSGVTRMSILSFTLATTAGTIPESILFTYVGSILRHTRISLWYLFILVVALGAVGPILTYLFLRNLQEEPLTSSKKRQP